MVSKQANIGISLPGSGETPVAPVFVDGVKTVTLKGKVPTAAQKTIAEDIATAKAVGYRVRNELTVGR